jgi:hypothetical protein
MTRVIAIDPGITTGIAEGAISDDGELVFQADQATISLKFLWEYLHRGEPDHLVFETFEFRQGKQRGNIELFARNMIGVIELYGELHPIFIAPQKAAQAKEFMSNDRLKEEQAWIKGKEHARDAIKHLLYWFYWGVGYKYNKKGHRLNTVPFL